MKGMSNGRGELRVGWRGREDGGKEREATTERRRGNQPSINHAIDESEFESTWRNFFRL
jgi:hypothetical protein